MASFRERAEAELLGTSVEQVQARKSSSSNGSFRERAQAELSRSVQKSNAEYRNQQRQRLHAEEEERKRAAQNKAQMQKIGRQTNRQRFDTGENESQLGYGNYLSYKGTDQREIPWKQMTQDQIAKAKQEAAEKQAATRKATARGGGFGANGASYEAKPSLGKTILNVANKGAGEGFVTPVYETIDFLANLAPNAVAGIKGVEDPESTFTGQLFKPVTDATQKALDYVKGETGASAAIVQEATKGNKTAQVAADIGSGVVGAIPNAALAIMTAGGSLPALAPQTTGASGAIMNAVQKVAANPSFQLSYIQTLGGAYQDAKDAGASELDASAAAFISAAANALVEVGGGLETLPGELRVEDLSSFDKALKWVTSSLDEGKEEVVQGVISSLTNKAAANSNAPYFSMTDENAVINPARMGKEFGMGAAVGAVLGGAQMFGADAIDRISNRHTGANADSNADSNANATVNQRADNANATVDQRADNAEIDYTDTDTETATEATDPMEFAVRETMRPSPERQAMDEAIQRTADWMNGKEQRNAEATVSTAPQGSQNQQTRADNGMDHGSVGAAELGFNPYSNYQNQTDAADFLPEGANAARPVDMPKIDPTGRQVRRGAKTIYGAEATTDARAAQMENEYMEGLYGYDPVRDKPTLEKAKANLKEEGYDRAYSRVAEKLAAVKDMKQTAMEAFLLYSDAVQSGRDGDAANLCLLLTESGTEFGQGVQVFSMFRKLSPEGQLYALQKSVERLNKKMNPETTQDVTIKQEALREIVKQRDAALQMLEDLNARDHGIPVEDWMQEVGKQLAKAVGEMPKPPKPKTVAQTVRSDLLRFAKDYLPKKKRGVKRTAVDTLRDFFSNRDQYLEAWDAARKAYREANKWDGDADFANATITYNGVGTDPVMMQAIVDEAVSQELTKKGVNIKSKLGDRGVLERQIADSLIKQTDASGADAAMIRDAVVRYFNENYRYDQSKAEADIQADISKVVKEMGQTAAEIIRSSKQSKTRTAKAIADALVAQYGISKKNAKTAADMIVDQFNQYVAEKSENTLRNMFMQREGKKKEKRTFEDRFDELVNLGAFTNENWSSAVNEKLFGPGVVLDPNLVQEYINAPDQDSRDAVMTDIYKNIGQQIPTTFMDAANQWRYMSMLLNPSTHLKNMGGNLSMMMLKGGKDIVGAGIEVAANKVTKGKTGRTKSILNPFSAKDRALMETAWSDFANVEDDVAGIGKNADNLMGKVGEYRNMWKLNDPKTKTGQVVDKALRAAEKVPQANSKVMNLEDRLFSQPDYALSLAGYMKANNQTEITADARDYAIKEAQKATFRDANEVSTFARNMGHSNSKLWNGIVNAVFPFKGTPANVGVRAVEYSPVGLVNTIAKARKASKNGTFKATDFIDDISANIVGTAGLSVLGYWLASNGWLRMAGVGDDKEKEEQKENGYRDNSFKLFGYSVPENAFTSVSAPMFIGAAAYEALASKALSGEAYTLDDYIQALSTTVDPLLEQTMLTGLNDVLTTARYNQGGLGDTLGEMGLQVAGNWLSSFIPTLISRISAASDGIQRQVYIDKNKPLQGVQRQVQNLMMKTPLRKHLNERVDRYGNVEEQEGIFDTGNETLDDVLNFGYNVITPSYASKIKENPISDELSRLYRSTDVDNSERKLFQSDAPKSIQINGETRNLTGDEYESYEKIRGSNTTEYLGALQNNPLYDSMDDAMQGYATDKMYDYIEQTSKAELGIGYEPTDNWIADLQGKSEAEIIETVLYKTFESAVDGKQYSSKYEGMDDLMDQGKLSDAMAITMMPENMKTAYTETARKGGVSVNEWLDMYAYAYPAGKTEKGTQDKEKVRNAALEYINKQNWGEDKKTAAASAVYQFLTDTLVIEREIPHEWALRQGDSGLAYVENSMSDGQKENYEKYVKGYLDNDKMKLYLDAYKFKGQAKSDYEEDGKTVKYAAKDKVIDYIDSLSGLTNREKIRIYLGLGYSDKNIPYWWY